jgi:L-seryl-tRNA(Ser) seleniumtransferase
VQSVVKLLRELTGAEAAAVTNNNAAATMLTLAALAGGKEVVVSRGQLVEIGGSYRLPDVMTVSGARLREVGTTNKTRADDYEQAIGPETAALMRVHSSNFVIRGFTAEAALEELIEIGRRHQLPVIDDIGSGALIDFAKYGVQDEPLAAHSIKLGADVVLFSGDKLLGGPQCGIILGKAEYVDRIVRHPMMRAMRVGKLTLAALAATLRLYREDATAERSIPLLALIATPTENLKNRAERLAPQLAAADAVDSVEVLPGEAFLGGGSVPTQRLETWCVTLKPKGVSVDELAKQLRMGTPSVFPRVQQDRLWLDLRTVFAKQDMLIVDAVQAIGKSIDEGTTPANAEAST